MRPVQSVHQTRTYHLQNNVKTHIMNTVQTVMQCHMLCGGGGPCLTLNKNAQNYRIGAVTTPYAHPIHIMYLDIALTAQVSGELLYELVSGPVLAGEG